MCSFAVKYCGHVSSYGGKVWEELSKSSNSSNYHDFLKKKRQFQIPLEYLSDCRKKKDKFRAEERNSFSSCVCWLHSATDLIGNSDAAKLSQTRVPCCKERDRRQRRMASACFSKLKCANFWHAAGGADV